MQQPLVQMGARAAGWRVVNGDVVLYQMLFVVQMAFIAARMAIRVHHHHAKEDLMKLSSSQNRLQSRLTVLNARVTNPHVLIIIHAVKQKTACGDVVRYQMQFVVKIVNIVAPRDTHVMYQQDHVRKNLKLSKFVRSNLPLKSRR